MKENILSQSHADLPLFKRFNATLWSRISETGFSKTCSSFRQKNKTLLAVCLLGKRGKGESKVDDEKDAMHTPECVSKRPKGL